MLSDDAKDTLVSSFTVTSMLLGFLGRLIVKENTAINWVRTTIHTEEIVHFKHQDGCTYSPQPPPSLPRRPGARRSSLCGSRL